MFKPITRPSSDDPKRFTSKSFWINHLSKAPGTAPNPTKNKLSKSPKKNYQ